MPGAAMNGSMQNGSIQHSGRRRYRNFGEILDQIGQFGRYQIFTCVVIQLSTIMWSGSHCFLFLAMVEPDIRCQYPDENNDNSSNIATWIHYVTPKDPNYCSVYGNCSENALETSNDLFFSPVQEWLLICDRVYIQHVITALYFTGRIVGSFLGGHLGDWVGRKKGFFVAQFFILISSVMSIASTHWITLAACQCLNGFMFGIIIVTSYALMFEYTSNRYSLIANASFQYCLGYIVVAGVGAITRNWRYYLIFINLISAPLLVAYLLFLESPRFLIVKGKLHQAADVLTNMASARWNNKGVEVWSDELTNVPRDDTGRFYSFLHLFSTKPLAVQSLLQVLSTFTCSIISSTFSLNQAPTGLFLQFVYFGLFRLWIPLAMILLDFHVRSALLRHPGDNFATPLSSVRCTRGSQLGLLRHSLRTSIIQIGIPNLESGGWRIFSRTLGWRSSPNLWVPKCGRRHFYLTTLGIVGICLGVVLVALATGADASSPVVYVMSLMAVIVNASGYFMSVLHITAAVYPTVVRCTAFGALQITDDLGSVFGRLGFETLVIGHWIGWPYFICLCFVIMNFLLALRFQKETKGKPYYERIEDIKQGS